MPKASFDEVWDRIVENEGETFQTLRKLKLTYKVDGNSVCPSRTEYKIPKSDFKKAYGMIPIRGPGDIGDVVRGPSYIWAILRDKKISVGCW